MTGWIITAAYIVGLVATARATAVMWINTDDDEDSTEGRIIARILGVGVGLIWPIAVAGALITGRLPKSSGQLRRELQERDQRIAELERELGIGGTT